jgi:GTP cyclohydrolase II
VFFSEAQLPTALGTFRVRVYRSASGDESIALVCGQVEGREDVPVRVHSACLTSETFGSLKCDCRQQLDLSLEYIQRHGGVVVYLHQEGRGIGSRQQDQGLRAAADGPRHDLGQRGARPSRRRRTYEAAHGDPRRPARCARCGS